MTNSCRYADCAPSVAVTVNRSHLDSKLNIPSQQIKVIDNHSATVAVLPILATLNPYSDSNLSRMLSFSVCLASSMVLRIKVL